MTTMTMKDTLQAKQAVQMQKAKLMLDNAERAQRGLTPEEEHAHAELLANVEATAARLEKLDTDSAMTAEIARLSGATTRSGADLRASLGTQFVNSETYGWLKHTAKSRPSGAWSSPSSELLAATLTEDAASGGDLVTTDYRTGIVPIATRPLTVADLLASGTTNSNSISYMKETTFTNAAAAVAEGATKPESTLIFDLVTDQVRKIAHWIPVTDELLEDVQGIRSYLDVRLRLGVELTLDDQLLNGSGTAPAIQGLLNRAGLAAPVARGTDVNADAILKQISAIQTATGRRPDGIVMNPANWQTIMLTKDANGQYYGNGPFSGMTQPNLWGINVAVSAAIVANTALVGAFKSAAQLFRHGGLRVEASSSHSDYFTRNLVAIRAELRAALIVPVPSAFGAVTGLN